MVDKLKVYLFNKSFTIEKYFFEDPLNFLMDYCVIDQSTLSSTRVNSLAIGMVEHINRFFYLTTSSSANIQDGSPAA
jgi:hypothetical protein